MQLDIRCPRKRHFLASRSSILQWRHRLDGSMTSMKFQKRNSISVTGSPSGIARRKMAWIILPLQIVWGLQWRLRTTACTSVSPVPHPFSCPFKHPLSQIPETAEMEKAPQGAPRWTSGRRSQCFTCLEYSRP
ncbi:hypothetical protein BS47DRAFT_1386010 [Hydnum rufescens UP504]|uniref:Uncharacterized protein n=1 Tax=Hydnum rufescens UP504 TaxID=1448309 RepID=A0A9P6AH67_9AGAM|nr:hypothetical protein BS47DRAFT_1386010 [Hydnum rufescens UP504]